MGTLTELVLDGALLRWVLFYGKRVFCLPEPRGASGVGKSVGTALWKLWIVPYNPGCFFTWDQETVLPPGMWRESGTPVISGMGLSFVRWGDWARSAACFPVPYLRSLTRVTGGGGHYSNHHVLDWEVVCTPRAKAALASWTCFLAWALGSIEYWAHRCCFMWTMWTSTLTCRYMSFDE